METIAEIVKQLRAQGMTQAQMADAIGVSQAYISGIESGKRGGRTPATTLTRAKQVLDQKRGVNGAKRRSTDAKG